MGATSSIVTGKMDLVKKGLSYDTLCVPACPRAGASRLASAAVCMRAHNPRGVRCSQQHLGIVGDKSLARIKHLHLCSNKLSALPSKTGIMVSLVEIRCTDNWLKFLPEVRRNSECRLHAGGAVPAASRVVSDFCRSLRFRW